jgi:hypothetical protein
MSIDRACDELTHEHSLSVIVGIGVYIGPLLPAARLSLVLLHPNALTVASAQISLRSGVALLCRLAEPLHCLCFIPLHPNAQLVAVAQAVLRIAVPLRRRFAIPFYGHRVVLLHPSAIEVADSQAVLRIAVPLRRCFPIPFYGHRLVLLHSKAIVTTAAKQVLGPLLRYRHHHAGRKPSYKTYVNAYFNIGAYANCVCFDPKSTRGYTAAQEGETATTKLQQRLASGGRRSREQFFKFDRVFGPEATQKEVFDTTAKGVIDSVLTGHNATVFAYGATGSGKTHTMIGNEVVGGGVMVLSVQELFAKMEERKLDSSYKLCISYLEVYNETIRDLLEPSGPLALRESGKSGCVVANLTKHYPSNAEEVFTLIQTGNANRIQSATEANAQSSRSHAVLQIMIEQQDRGAGIKRCGMPPTSRCLPMLRGEVALSSVWSTGWSLRRGGWGVRACVVAVWCACRAVKTGKLSLIDLAGSERASASANRGKQLKEGANINKSLLALSSCINALCKSKAAHVPFRNSKLTRLLKDSLGGNCRTVMISNISPCGCVDV